MLHTYSTYVCTCDTFVVCMYDTHVVCMYVRHSCVHLHAVMKQRAVTFSPIPAFLYQ